MKSKFSLKIPRHSLNLNKSSRSFSIAVVCSSLISPFLILPAHADNYHSVEPGDTLSSVAKRYNVSTETLRSANKLSLGDTAQLAAMLLRIPGASDQAEVKMPVRTASTTTGAASNASRFSGTVTKFVAV